MLNNALTAQPAFPAQIDWNNPLTKGLIAVIDRGTVNPVSGKAYTLSSNYFTYAGYLDYPAGRALSVDGTGGSNTARLNLPTNGLSTQSFSIAGKIRTRTAAGAGVGMRAGTNNILLWRNTGWDTRIGGTDYTAAGTYNLNQVYDYALTSGASAVDLYVDGVSTVSGGAGGAGTLSDTDVFSDSNGGGAQYIDIWWLGVWNRKLTAQEVWQLKVNPWQIFKAPERRYLLAPIASVGSSGTSATTNANDTSSASGTTTVLGTSAKTNSNDTSSAAGTTTVTGSSATTNANDACDASGTVSSSVTGTSATTNANDTPTAAGTTTVIGSSASSNGQDAANSAGYVGGISGTVDYINANDSALGFGTCGASNTGGHPGYRRKTRKQIEDERIALGIIPAPVVKIAEKIAKKVIRKAAEQREPDVLAYLAQQDQQAAIEREMRREMARHRQMWDRAYQRLIEIAVEERLQIEQDNEEALLLLLAA